MAYKELIKNFDNLRDYMRDFFVYGYRTRNDFTQKSSRTYDNERRRVENYLGKYIKWEYGKQGKRIFLSVDATKIGTNPFYQAYFCKSFTNNDITLHFFILDLLATGQALKVEELTDLIAENYGETFEPQTVRAKLNEYLKVGLLLATKEGRAFRYSLSPDSSESILGSDPDTLVMLDFFSGAAPFGIIGQYLKNRYPNYPENFIFKHRFIAHTLDDNILSTVLKGMRENRTVKFSNFASRTQTLTEHSGLPLKILISAQTGRRYLLVKLLTGHRIAVYRLDHIKTVKFGEKSTDFPEWRQKADTLLACSWGSTIRLSRHADSFEMDLYIDEETELFVLHRLQREKRHGQIEKIAENHYRYTIQVTNAGELMAWVKSFTGRILRISSSNPQVYQFYNDMERLQSMYREE